MYRVDKNVMMLFQRQYASAAARFAVFFSIFFHTLYANEAAIITTISDEMNHYEEVATLTKNNERYQPYIISVFQGKEMEKLGIKDLEEALSLAPGVDITTDNFNNRTMIFRGSNPQAYGQTKLFIDGTLVNEVFFDSYTQYLKMPIEMIKRIEVTRGPGSKTDGVNAYAGSIHVITYAEEFEAFESPDKVVFKGGSYDYLMGGFVKSYKAGDLKIFTDFYYQQDDKMLYAGQDGYSQGSMSFEIPGVVNYDNRYLSRKGDAPLWVKNWNLGITIDYKDFYIKARHNEYTHGSAYGINWFLPDKNDHQDLPSQYLEVGYDTTIHDVTLSLKAGIKNDSWGHEAHLGPVGLTFFNYYAYMKGDPSFDITNGTTFEDVMGRHYAKQRSYYTSEFLRYKGWDDHKITFGHRYLKEETYDTVTKLHNWFTGIGLADYSDDLPFFDKDAERETHVVSLQDEYYASDVLSLIYGFNYEKTNHTNEMFDPSISLVYQPDQNNIYKLIYSQSHRNPSWQEMFTKYNASRWGNPNLDPERVSAYEASYIHNFSTDSYLQANIFMLQNEDQIYYEASSPSEPTFFNGKDTDIYGTELEFKGNLTAQDQFYLSYSYVDGEDSDGEALANVAHHMAKAYYIYDLNEALSLSGIIHYVGEKERLPSDTRDKVAAYTKVDVAIRYERPGNGFHVTLSGKNIFDADIRYPAEPYYVDDYAQEGANFMLTFGKEF